MTGRARAGKYAHLSALPRSAPQPLHLDEVYREEVGFVWRTCRYLGVAADDAEDVVHEVFIVVKRRLEDYDAGRSMRSWLAGITRHVVMHHRRSVARAARKKDAMPPPEAREDDPHDIVARREAAALLQAFLEGIDGDKRDAFVLCELEGLSAPEVADVLECSVNTIYSRQRAARQAFEKQAARLRTTWRREGG